MLQNQIAIRNSDFHHSGIKITNAKDMAINAKPMTRKVPLQLYDVVALNNSIPPARPRNNVATPPIIKP